MILQMDWVERRAEEEKMLRSQLPIAWEHLCGAMQRAVSSYMRLFTDTGADATFGRQYGNEATVTLSANNRSGKFCQARIAMDMKSGKVTVAYAAKGGTVEGLRLTARFHSNEGVSFYFDETRLSFDEASEKVVSRVLFPADDQWV